MGLRPSGPHDHKLFTEIRCTVVFMNTMHVRTFNSTSNWSTEGFPDRWIILKWNVKATNGTGNSRGKPSFVHMQYCTLYKPKGRNVFACDILHVNDLIWCHCQGGKLFVWNNCVHLAAGLRKKLTKCLTSSLVSSDDSNALNYVIVIQRN